MDLHTLLLALLWFGQINADIPRTPIPTSMLNESWRHDLPEDTTVDVYESLPDAMAAVTASISLNDTTWPDGQFVSGSILVLPGGLGALNETAAPRTQVSYNYSISKTVWNLDADSNAISLVNCVYAANGSAVDLVVQSVENVTPYGPGQILLVSSRWGCVNVHGVLAAQAQLHVLEMVVLADERVLRLVVSPAALNASFATMSMHYRSNQFDLNESAAAETSRRLDTVTRTFFSYVPNYKCTTGCGAYDLSDSQCFQYMSDQYLAFFCPGSQYQMYIKSLTTKACGLIHNCALPSGLKYNPVRECTTACGAYGLAADQCFQFDSTRRISSGDCPGSLYFMRNVDSTWKECGYKRGCIPSIGRTMTYNMVNGAVDKTDIELSRSAGCGTGNFLNAPSGSGCVRVGCANCAYTFTVNEIQISLDYDVSLSSAWVAGSATLYGSGFASAGFSLYAPDGVTWKRTVSLVDISLTYPALNLLGFDVEFTLEYALEETYTATMTTSATPFVMSKSVTLSNLVATAAYDSRSGKSQQTSVDVATTTQAPQRGDYVAFNFVYDQRTTVGLYAEAAGLTLGVDVAWSDFVQLYCKGGVLPALASTAVVPSTPPDLTFGNCAVPHLLELAIFSGRRDVVVTGYFSFEYSPLDFDYNWPVSIPSLSTNVSRFSFCYAPPYTLTLNIALNPSDAKTLSSSTTLQAQLLAAMGQALGLPAFTANLFALKSISTTTGTVALTVMTPVAVSNVYPSFSALSTYINARAETDEYKNAVNKALNLGCSPGYWGSVCQFRCFPPPQCTWDSVCTCDQSSGAVRTCRSCVDGQWGNVCQYTCTGYSNCDPTSLITCDSSSGAITCAKCNPGYCGSDCQYSCTAPSTCAGSSRDAVTCSQSTCAAVSCQQCNTGYYGNKCQHACTPPAACVSSGRTACAQSSGVASTCSACKTGYWGSICQSPCTVPATCDSSSNVTCTQSTGAAVTCGQCNPGYYGSACQYSCTAPAECSSSGQITCAQSNGVASTCSACKTGYWGSACQSSCIAPATCTSGDTVTCDQSTGATVACGECSPGYYGSACQWSCVAPATCSFGDTVTCHQSTGAAVACGECSPGYYGSACQYSCSRPTTCTSNGTLSCDQYSGTVDSCQACQSGSWGRTCQYSCTARSPCATTITVTCDGGDGSLVACSSCATGFWGSRCQNACTPPSTCDSNAETTCDAAGVTLLCSKCAASYTGATCTFARVSGVLAPPQRQASLSFAGPTVESFTGAARTAFVAAVAQTFAQLGSPVSAADITIVSVTEEWVRSRGRQLSTAGVVVVFSVAAAAASAWQTLEMQPSVLATALVQNRVATSSQVVLLVAPQTSPPSSAPTTSAPSPSASQTAAPSTAKVEPASGTLGGLSGSTTLIIIGAAGGAVVLAGIGCLVWCCKRMSAKTYVAAAPLQVQPAIAVRVRVERAIDDTVPGAVDSSPNR